MDPYLGFVIALAADISADLAGCPSGHCRGQQRHLALKSDPVCWASVNGFSDAAAALALSHVVLAVPLLPILAIAAWRHGGVKNIQKHVLLGLGIGVLLCVAGFFMVWGIGLMEPRHLESTPLTFLVIGVPLAIWILTSNVAGHSVPGTNRWISAASAIAAGACFGFGSPALFLYRHFELRSGIGSIGFENIFVGLLGVILISWAAIFLGTWAGAARATRWKRPRWRDTDTGTRWHHL